MNVWLRDIPCQTRGLADAVDGQTAGVEANGIKVNIILQLH